MAKTAKEWNGVIERRGKQLKREWLKDAHATLQVYDGTKQAVPYNILYSNTETILPALYNSTPRPEVTRRYTNAKGSERALDNAVCQVAERVLEYSSDTNLDDSEAFDDVARGALFDALVPGMGQARVVLTQREGYQSIGYETVPYDRFLWGYARKWAKVPWVAFGHDLSKADFEQQFSAFTKTDDYKNINWKDLEDQQGEDGGQDPGEEQNSPTILVWEIWDAIEQQVYYVSDIAPDAFLLQEAFPLQLSTRFPCPEPLRFVKRSGNLTPRPLYSFYKEQAEEINDITNRLRKLVKALRVRGVYNSTLPEIQNLLNEDGDNTLIPSESAIQLAEQGGLDKHIWLLPIDTIIAVAMQLYQAREQSKGVIYEIMGIGDILRGVSVASETARAQEIKNQWGSLRIKRAQRDTQIFCRELFRIAFEFATHYYTPATFASITKLPYLFQSSADQLRQGLAEAKQAQMQQQLQGQPPGPPPPVPPEAALLDFPTWEQVTQALKDTFGRTYRIDIETNSTVDLEATEDKQSIAEFMNAFGQFMSGIVPLVQQGALSIDVAKVLLGEITRRFRFGRRVEDALETMQASPPQNGQDDAKQVYELKAAKIEADAARRESALMKQLVDLSGRLAEQKVNNKLDQVQNAGQINAVKSDYVGKMTLAQTDLAHTKLSSAHKDLSARLSAQAQEVLSSIEAAKAQHQQLLAAAAPAPAPEPTPEPATEESPESEAQEQQLLTAILAGQQQLAEAMSQLIQLTKAPRKRTLILGPDGKPVGAVSQIQEGA